jgi:hypothetical protein
MAVLDFSWPVPLDDGDAISSILEASVVAGTVSIGATGFANGLVTGVISGGEYGENAVIRLGARTTGGRDFFEDFLLRMDASPAVPTPPTGSETAADIAADLVLLRAARTKLAVGERIEDVWRSGRRLVYASVTLKEIDALIQKRENDLAQAEAGEAGRPRRRAISLGWPN